MIEESTRNVGSWITGFGLGHIGDNIFYFALAWSAAQQARSPLDASLIVTAGALVRTSLILTGGSVTDRVGARKVSLGSDFLRFSIAGAFCGLTLGLGTSMWSLYLLSILFGLIDAFFLPAVGAMPPRIVPASSLPRAQSARSVVQRIAGAIGPPLGGVIIGHGSNGLSRSLLVCAALFLASFLLLLFTKELGTAASSRGDAGSSESGVWSGIKYAVNDPVLGPALALITVAELIVAGLTVSGLAIYGADQNWSSTQTSFALSAFAAGSIVTALVMFVKQSQGTIGTLVTTNIALMGLGFASVGLFPHIVLKFLGLAVAGAASGVSATLLVTLFLVSAKEDYLGRVMSLLTLAVFGVVPLANFLFGVTADGLSPGAAFVIFGGLLTVVGISALRIDKIRAFALDGAA